MILRWLHKLWKYFWTLAAVLLGVALLLGGLTFGVLQTDLAQRYIVERLENDFRNTFPSRLEITRLEGTLPFRARLDSVTVSISPGPESPADTLVAVDRVSVDLDVWALLRNTLAITGFSVENPRVRIRTDNTGTADFVEAFRPRPGDDPDAPGARRDSWFRGIEIVAPSVRIRGGSLFAEGHRGGGGVRLLPDPLRADSINADFFLELNEDQRFWDIRSLSMRVRGLRSEEIALSGQVYNDRRYLEFNGFTVRTGRSELRISGEVDGVNLYAGEVERQLRAARYDVTLRSAGVVPSDLEGVLPGRSGVDSPVDFSFQAEGKVDSMHVDEFRVGFGESFLTADGFLDNMAGQGPLQYRLNLLNLVLRRADVEQLAGRTAPPPYRLPESLRMEGRLSGTADSVSVDLRADGGEYGRLQVAGNSRLAEPYRYALSVGGSAVNLGPLWGNPRDSTSLTFDSRVRGNGLDPAHAVAEFTADIYESRAWGVPVDELNLEASLVGGYLTHSYRYRGGPQRAEGKGSVDFSAEEPLITLKGSAARLDLSRLLPGLPLASTDIGMEYSGEFRGGTADRLQGRANLDITRSVVGGDTLRAHQFYVDLDEPGRESRSLRLTSSFFDLTLNGTIVPTEIYRQSGRWSEYVRERFRREILLEQPDSALVAGLAADSARTAAPAVSGGGPLALEGSLQLKDLDLLRSYLPGFPDLRSDASVSFTANANGNRLLLSGSLRADTVNAGSAALRGAEMEFTASLRDDRSLQEYSSIALRADIGQFRSGVVKLDTVSSRLTMDGDSLSFSQRVGTIGDEAGLEMAVEGGYSDSLLSLRLTHFQAGNENYSWSAQGVPALDFNRRDEVTVRDFVFRSRDEFIRVDGTMSPLPEKSLEYTIRNVSLERISELVQGELSFGGQLSGNLVTRSLSRQPSVQGELAVNRFTLADRLVGDLRFDSRLDEERERFDTRIRILTDSTKYRDYLEGNEQVGQNITLDGWFVAPDLDQPQDTVYRFDAEFSEIDLWVLTHIINPLQRVEGMGSGEGWLTGNLESYDFHADFELDEVYLSPKFLNTEYYASGHVGFDRQDGVLLDSLRLRDTQGGSGRLWGTVDLNDFRPITYMDLTLQLDELRFLDNRYDPDVPFFGTVAGSGRARLTGSNTDLLLRTNNPLTLTGDSRISIPLMQETELEEGSNFIRYVDSFDERSGRGIGVGRERISQLQGSGEVEEALERAIEDLTFNERFNLDLRFSAPENVNVDLVFDRVVGEVLSSRGTGQMRITMQDEEVQMFGRYEITGGTYRFVTGEIISRQLSLEPGGTIAWQGNPENARLDISAVYRARPDVSMFNYGGAAAPGDALDEGGRRVPVELVVEITGTVSSVSNDYFFRLPNSLELSSNSTLSYTLNQINRDEQQKLLQAASFLLADRFIPVQSTDQATTSLSQSLTRGATVINPLLSNQVISPLLSNQINSLLNSDVSRFDIDFNLNTYNEIDLGIALRLYNDRLILRREGQITGETSMGERIGDLNATYRIRRGLSLTAFHRQDQVFGNIATGSRTGDVTPSVDGIGLEAEVQFNTWQELRRRVADFFRRLFGGGEEDQGSGIADGSDSGHHP